MSKAATTPEAAIPTYKRKESSSPTVIFGSMTRIEPYLEIIDP
jgi:hypothetical protein